MGTASQSGGTVFFGEVRNILVDERRVPDPTYGQVDMSRLDPVVYAPMRYHSLGPPIESVGHSLRLYGEPGL